MKIEIPNFLKHLKVDKRGYPIPFFVPWKNGQPDFMYQDAEKQKLTTEKHLCHICGKKLHKDYHYFISGIHGLTNQVASDAAMHRECAEYSLQVCPHMLYQKAERQTSGDVLIPDIHAKEKPEKLYLIKSSKYRTKFYPEYGQIIIHYNMVSYETYVYENNKLKKEDNGIK